MFVVVVVMGRRDLEVCELLEDELVGVGVGLVALVRVGL